MRERDNLSIFLPSQHSLSLSLSLSLFSDQWEECWWGNLKATQTGEAGIVHNKHFSLKRSSSYLLPSTTCNWSMIVISYRNNFLNDDMSSRFFSLQSFSSRRQNKDIIVVKEIKILYFVCIFFYFEILGRSSYSNLLSWKVLALWFRWGNSLLWLARSHPSSALISPLPPLLAAADVFTIMRI